MEKEHYYWIDNIKVFACILVVLGHFFQSMIKSNILPASFLYKWFNETIYYFHVPLFFVCSGYLYQKFSKVYDFKSWLQNLIRKAVDLGVPYFVFSTATWVLKTTFSGQTNSEIGGLMESLFIRPISPYWFLYCLFLIFLITPTFKTGTMALYGLIIAVVLRIFNICGGNSYAVSILLSNEIWFVIGMCLVFVSVEKANMAIGYAMLMLFVIESLVFVDNGNRWISFEMSVISVMGFIVIFSKWNESCFIVGCIAKYSKSIFLMHTLFAAPLRIVLVKVGIASGLVHTLLGISISILAPILTEIIMKKTGWLDFFINPWKVILTKKVV